MILWIIALVLLALLGMIGFYQGAIRAGLSFVGLIIAAALAMPLAGVVGVLLKFFGMKHPVWLAFIAPLTAFVIILTIFKGAAYAIHRKVDAHYKYQDSDTRRSLFERLNQRLG